MAIQSTIVIRQNHNCNALKLHCTLKLPRSEVCLYLEKIYIGTTTIYHIILILKSVQS